MIVLTSMLTGLAVYLLIGILTDSLPRMLTGHRSEPVEEQRCPWCGAAGRPTV